MPHLHSVDDIRAARRHNCKPTMPRGYWLTSDLEELCCDWVVILTLSTKAEQNAHRNLDRDHLGCDFWVAYAWAGYVPSTIDPRDNPSYVDALVAPVTPRRRDRIGQRNNVIGSPAGIHGSGPGPVIVQGAGNGRVMMQGANNAPVDWDADPIDSPLRPRNPIDSPVQLRHDQDTPLKSHGAVRDVLVKLILQDTKTKVDVYENDSLACVLARVKRALVPALGEKLTGFQGAQRPRWMKGANRTWGKTWDETLWQMVAEYAGEAVPVGVLEVSGVWA